MARIPIVQGIALMLMTVAAAGCANRGEFGKQACVDSDRIAVYSNAVSAIYFDAAGKQIGLRAEELQGTEHDKMCPSPPPSGGGVGVCPNSPVRYCPVGPPGQVVCIKC
jgi:hypothetical protein